MEKDILDILLDEDDNDPITLYNEKGEAVIFEQIALIPMNGGIYTLLKPVQPIEGMGEDEALVFEVIHGVGESRLEVVQEDAIIDGVFDIYYELLEENT